MTVTCNKAHRCHFSKDICPHAEPHEEDDGCPKLVQNNHLCWKSKCIPATIVVVQDETELFPADTDQAIKRWFK